MPYKSIAELPPEFHGLPERGKRIAVQIMNVLEEQQIVGPAATQKTINMVQQLFNQGAGGWQQTQAKTADDKTAGIMDMVSKGIQWYNVIGALKKGGDMAGQASAATQNVNMAGDYRIPQLQTNPNWTAGGYSWQNPANQFKVNTASAKEGNIMANTPINSSGNYMQKQAGVELMDMMFKLADKAISNNVILKVAKYNDKGQVVGTEKIPALEFMGAFPKVACVIKVNADKDMEYMQKLSAEEAKELHKIAGGALGGKENTYGDWFGSFSTPFSKLLDTATKIPGALKSLYSTQMSDKDMEMGANNDAQRNIPTTFVETIVDNAAPFLAVAGAGVAANKLYGMYQRNQAYKKMFNLHPDLATEDPSKVGNLYDVISNYSPTIAKDPMTAGTVIKQMMQFPDVIPLDQIKTLASIEQATGKGNMEDRIMDAAQGTIQGALINRSNPQNMLYNKLYYN